MKLAVYFNVDTGEILALDEDDNNDLYKIISNVECCPAHKEPVYIEQQAYDEDGDPIEDEVEETELYHVPINQLAYVRFDKYASIRDRQKLEQLMVELNVSVPIKKEVLRERYRRRSS